MIIGEGSSGTVHIRKDNKSHVVKVFHKSNYELKPEFCQEVAALRLLKGSHYIPYIHHVGDHKITMERYFTDLSRYIESGNIKSGDLKLITYHVALALYESQNCDLIHQDVKPANVLLRVDSEKNVIGAVLADWGNSSLNGSWSKSRKTILNIQSLGFRAPEIILGTNFISPAMDVWGLGCIMLSIMTQSLSYFYQNNEISILMDIFYLCGTPKNQTHFAPRYSSRIIETFGDYHPDLVDLLSIILVSHPNQRATIVEVLNHPYFGLKSKFKSQSKPSIKQNKGGSRYFQSITTKFNNNPRTASLAQYFYDHVPSTFSRRKYVKEACLVLASKITDFSYVDLVSLNIEPNDDYAHIETQIFNFYQENLWAFSHIPPPSVQRIFFNPTKTIQRMAPLDLKLNPVKFFIRVLHSDNKYKYAIVIISEMTQILSFENYLFNESQLFQLGIEYYSTWKHYATSFHYINVLMLRLEISFFSE